MNAKHPRENLPYQVILALVKASGLLLKTGDRFFKSYGLTQCQFNVLMVLKYSTPEGCTQTELCSHLLVKAANMTSLSRRLLQAGLIERSAHPTDERAWIVKISKTGSQLLDRVEPEYYARIQNIMQVITETECREFLSMMNRMQEAILDQEKD